MVLEIAAPRLDAPAANAPGNAADVALDRARDCLLAKQAPEGYWVGELQGDSILESEYLLLKFILTQEHEPDLRFIANYLRRLQQPNGGWSLFPGGPPDLSATVKGYFALKLMGDNPREPHMARAIQLVRDLGGAERCNSFTKFYFAALGQISYDACPTILPEIVFLPKWFYFNLYNVSAWTRTMILPLSLVTTLRPLRQIEPRLGIAELYLDIPAANRVSVDPPKGFPRSWRQVFLRIDQLLKRYEESPIQPLRRHAIEASTKWLLSRLPGSEGLGAIFPPMVYMLIVFRALGYADDDPLVQQAQQQLRDFFIREGDTIRLQPCVSPVWDTGLALHALAEAQIDPDSPAARRATAWLLAMECRTAADWQRHCRPVDPSGWFFEFNNPHYPDVDDTAMAVVALARAGGSAGKDRDAAVRRGIAWLLAMQNDDGGWAAFDRTRSRPILEAIPFADHNAMQDPSCPDITGRVLECLGHCNFNTRNTIVRRAIRYLQAEQDDCGAWWGRWGVNFVYGTWQVLTGLRAVGQDMTADFVQRGVNWLRDHQKSDGSWGETCQSYDNAALKGQGESTPSQTAWGTMGILAAAGPNDPAVRAGINWLMNNQLADGSWEEDFFTGTGFPRVFYLKYHLYRLYFPLTALARFTMRKSESAAD
jgi:squalene-hopene/tetraprenyl-beta-curcumene cyclase